MRPSANLNAFASAGAGAAVVVAVDVNVNGEKYSFSPIDNLKTLLVSLRLSWHGDQIFRKKWLQKNKRKQDKWYREQQQQ